MKGKPRGDLLGPEPAGIVLFIHQLDPAHPHLVVIEVELLGLIDRVTDFYTLPDIGGGHLVEKALEADGGVVVDHPLVADEEDLIQLCLGEPPGLHSRSRGLVAVDGPLIDTGVELMVVVVLEP
jgi:hypothetical protein